MKSHCLTTTEFNQSALDNACDIRQGSFSRKKYFERISRIIERGILLFVVSLTLLSNYAAHHQLMSDVLLS